MDESDNMKGHFFTLNTANKRHNNPNLLQHGNSYSWITWTMTEYMHIWAVH